MSEQNSELMSETENVLGAFLLLKDVRVLSQEEFDDVKKAIKKQQKELNNIKEIEKSHQEENGKLRVELEQYKLLEANIDKANKIIAEKEKNKELEKKLKIAKQIYNDACICIATKCVEKDKIKERMEQTKKVHEDEMKPYQREYGLDVTYLSKKEKEELINKRNCLLTQIKTYEMLLEEK